MGALLATYGLIMLVYAMSKRWLPRVDLSMLHPSRVASPVGMATLAVLAALIWSAVMTLPDGRLHLYFLDVGQGDGILIQTPNGRQVLIDGGSRSQQLLTELGEVMPWWDRSLDMVVATHADSDHVGAQIGMAERFRIDYALDTPAMQADPDSNEWQQAVAASARDHASLSKGGWIDLGDGVALWLLWPPNVPVQGENASNENSLVVKVVYGDFSALLTGDAGIPSESTWLAEGLPLASTLLKVGHHGSSSSTSRGLVHAVDPRWAVIQVGGNNSYGHPTQAVLDLLAGRTIYRNDMHGRIHVATDGTQVWIETEK